MIAYPPSYKTGYARNASEALPKNRNLFDGLVGAWVPRLGPTGRTLQDVSGNKNHGTLTNMNPASDWVEGDDGWGLDFDGFNDYVRVAGNSTLGLADTDFTISLWIKWSAVAENDNKGVFSKYNSTTGQRGWMVATANTPGVSQGKYSFLYQSSAGSFNSQQQLHTTSAYDDDITHCLSFIFIRGQTVSIYVDGVLDNSKASSVPSSVANNSSDVLLASANNGSQNTAIASYAANIHNRALSPTESAQLHALKPGGMFERKRRKIFISPIVTPTASPWFFQNQILRRGRK